MKFKFLRFILVSLLVLGLIIFLPAPAEAQCFADRDGVGNANCIGGGGASNSGSLPPLPPPPAGTERLNPIHEAASELAGSYNIPQVPEFHPIDDFSNGVSDYVNGAIRDVINIYSPPSLP